MVALTAPTGKAVIRAGASRIGDTFALKLSGRSWAVRQYTVGAIRARCRSTGERVVIHLDIERYLCAAREFMRCAIGYHLNPLSLDPIAVDDPNALAVAVAGFWVARIGICLLQRPISIEHVHVVRKRCVNVIDKPCANNRIETNGPGRKC